MIFKLKNCCFFVNLRLGTFIIALICAVVEFISLVIQFAEISNIWDYKDASGSGYIYFLRFIFFVIFFFSFMKLVLCASLYVGLLDRRPDQLEMWYKGYMLCELLSLAFVILKAIKEAETDNILFWAMLVGNLLLIMITFYFILVVRSYHHQMCRQPNCYQDFSYQETNMTHCGKPNANGEIILFSAPMKEKDGGLTPNFVNGGGMVFATPQSSQMNIPVMPSFLLNNTKRPSIADLNAVENGHQRKNSVSTPTKKRLSLSFDNNVELK